MTYKAAKYVFALLLALPFAAPCVAQNSIFVQFDTFKCQGAGNANFPNFSAASNVEFGGTGAAASTGGGSGGGSSGGKTTFADIKVAKALDDCTPLLFKSLATGSHIAAVKISMVNRATPAIHVLDILLEDVLITSDQYSETAAGPPSEVLTIAWTKITVTHVASGNQFTWNRVTNSSF